NWWVISGANTYTGPTTISSTGSGQWLGATNTLPSTTALTILTNLSLNPTNAAGGVVVGNYSQNIGSLAGSGTLALGSAVLTTGNDGLPTTFSGVMSGTGSVVKVGVGTFTLSGNNTYTGGTTISAGSVLANGQTGTNSGTGTGP